MRSVASRSAVPTAAIATTPAGAAATRVFPRWACVTLRNVLTAFSCLVLEDHAARQLDAVVGVDVDDPNLELVAEIAAVPGMTQRAAEQVKAYL